MSGCTEPGYGHRTHSGKDACPVRRGYCSTTRTHSTPIPIRHLMQRESVQVAEILVPSEVPSLVGHEQVRQFSGYPLRRELTFPSVIQSRVFS